MISRYAYVVEIYRSDNTPAGRAPVHMDWAPAEEWARFMFIRRLANGSTEVPRDAAIEPVWQAEAGEPYVQRVSVSISRPEGGSFRSDLPLTYFAGRAREAAAVLIEKGKLAEGETYRFVVAAFPLEQNLRPENGRDFDAEEIAEYPPVTKTDSEFVDLVQRSVSTGSSAEIDMPVFISQRILAETAQLSRSAGGVESGGVLIGHLRWSPESEIYAQVTAQIPARHVIAEASKLTFTSETWTDVRTAINLRNKGEIMLGWWHSHVARELCKDCPVERQRVCRYSGDFFSAHDHALHRAVFPRAYSIALVANDVAFGDVTHSMFGWREGGLELRGFYAVGETEFHSNSKFKRDEDAAYAHK